MSGYYTIHSKALRGTCPFIGQTVPVSRFRNALFKMLKKVGSNCGQRQKSLLRSPLKIFFCKLCTTLSTQIVDKLLAQFQLPRASIETVPRSSACAQRRVRAALARECAAAD